MANMKASKLAKSTAGQKPVAVACTRLLDLLFKITGIPWEWYEGDPEWLPIEGRWQLMPRDPSDEDAFWNYHLWNRRQWFDSKYEAFAYLLDSWFIYRSNPTIQGRADCGPYPASGCCASESDRRKP